MLNWEKRMIKYEWIEKKRFNKTVEVNNGDNKKRITALWKEKKQCMQKEKLIALRYYFERREWVNMSKLKKKDLIRQLKLTMEKIRKE